MADDYFSWGEAFTESRTIRLGDLMFLRTCWVYPEQYTVTNKDGEEVGYVRARHGLFRVDCPRVGEETVLEEEAEHEMQGLLDDAEDPFDSKVKWKESKQRLERLGRAAERINLWLERRRVNDQATEKESPSQTNSHGH